MATRIYLPTEPLFDAGEGCPMIVLHGSLYNFFSLDVFIKTLFTDEPGNDSAIAVI